MKTFAKVFYGYNPEEVNSFLDEVIKNVETLVKESDEKDEKIKLLQQYETENELLKEKLNYYKNNEEVLNKAIFMSEQTSNEIKQTAYKEKEIILNEAKKNADRIINDALMKAEKINRETENLRRNIYISKSKIRDNLETMIDLTNNLDR
jgi:cell division initiation protein